MIPDTNSDPASDPTSDPTSDPDASAAAPATMPNTTKGHRIRQPLYQSAAPGQPATPHRDNPAPLVLAMYRRIWETRMRGLEFVNPELEVDIAGFRQYQGDWVGAVVTPWFINLFVLPGGGTLWADLGAGERHQVSFPVGALEFIADHDPESEVPAYLYCPLVAPVSQVASQAAAIQIALDALQTLFTPKVILPVDSPPSAGVGSTQNPTEVGVCEKTAPPATAVAGAAPGDASTPVPSRRAFFRTLAGKR